MALFGSIGDRQRFSPAAPRVGLFGVIGTNNIGNEGMLQAVLTWLKIDHPDAVVDFMCTRPERVKARYDASAIPMNWYQKHGHRATGVTAIVFRTLGKKLRWSVCEGVDELVGAYTRYGLTFRDFMSSRFVRLRRIRELLSAGIVDEMLRRQIGGPLPVPDTEIAQEPQR